MKPNTYDVPIRRANNPNESEASLSFGNTDLNNINNNQSSEKIPLLNKNFKSNNDQNEEIISNQTNQMESDSSCISYIDKLIEEIGFNNYFILNILGCGLSYLCEGTQVFIISILNPVFKQLFDNKIYGDFLISFLSSSYFLGYLIGCLSASLVSRKFNRRKPIVILNLIVIFFSCMLICWENIYWIIVVRILTGFSLAIAISLFFTNFSETIPSVEREISVFSTHAFYRCGIFYTIGLFDFIIPTFDVDSWKQFYIFSIVPNFIIVVIAYFHIVESPKFLFYKKNINGTINSLLEMSKFKRSNVIITEDKVSEIKNLFYSENPEHYDVTNEMGVEVNKLSNFQNTNYNSIITNHEIKINNNNFINENNYIDNLTIAEVKVKSEKEIQKNNASVFSFTEIFSKKYILLTFISSSLYAIGGAISHCILYYLPIVLFKISEENKSKDFSNSAIQNLSNTDPKQNLKKGTSFDENFSLIFFISQIVAIFGLIPGVFLAKKLGRKLTIILNFIPCLIAAFFCCFYTSMILPSATIINFFVVIPLVTVKLFLVEAYNTKIRDAGYGFGYFCKTVADCFVPFIINGLINHGILAPMYYISAISGGAILLSLFISGKYDGMKIK